MAVHNFAVAAREDGDFEPELLDAAAPGAGAGQARRIANTGAITFCSTSALA